MERHLKTHLYDISTAIDEVQSFFEQVPFLFDEYCKNLMLRRAIERNIGIIGESSKQNPPGLPWHRDFQFARHHRNTQPRHSRLRSGNRRRNVEDCRQ